MKRTTPFRLQPRLAAWPYRRKAFGVLLVVAVAGTMYVLFGLAAAGLTVLEAEKSVPSGSAKVVVDDAASGGQALRFGGTPAVDPALNVAILHAFTGGDSIALRWKPPAGQYPALKYAIFRDGKQIAVADAATAQPWTFEAPGTLYVDRNVVPGTEYSYQIQAEANGKLGALSDPVAATHPLANETTPVPSVSIDLNGQSGADSFISHAKEDVEVWYPKVVDMITGGAYPVPSSITVRLETGCDNPGWVAGGATLHVCMSYITANPFDRNLMTHELTHIIQGYTKSGIGAMTIEGMADWVSYRVTNRENSMPAEGSSYTDGYATGAYFLEWISTTYNKPNLVRDINVAAHKDGTDGLVTVQAQTGKTASELWTQMTGRP